MKILKAKTLLLCCCYLPAIGLAEDVHNLSFTAYLATDYMFRGVSQTNNDAALQMGLDYSHSSGFLAGSFASNVDYNSRTRREQDVYIGYNKEFVNGMGFDVYAWRYGYHNESEFNYAEYTVGIRYSWLDVKYWYSDDYFGTQGRQDYYEAALSVAINDDYNLTVRGGHGNFDSQTGIADYNDYSISLFRSYKGLDFQLQASSTDGRQFGDLEDERIELTVSKSFGLMP